MKSFELVFNKLTELFIEKLPDYIQKINEKHNDGIVIKPFENKDLITTCNKLPSFKFTTEKAEYTDKDRIIENTVFNVSFKLQLPSFQNGIIILWRYIEAVNKMIDEEKEIEEWQKIELKTVEQTSINLRITM